MAWWFRDRRPHTPIRVLTAAARRLDLENRKEARQMRELRQGWQSDAWTYRDTIGELRYAINFLANCTARMRLYVAAYPVDLGETDDPKDLEDVEGIPPEVQVMANAAMRELGQGKLAIRNLLGAASTNTSVAGEYYLLGQQDAETGAESWTIRSVDEIIIKDDHYEMREVPYDPAGDIPWVELDPDTSVVSRIWTPHPRFRLLADSPCRAILEECEALLIWRRMVRAAGRSRLAGRGILKVPDELSLKVPLDDDADPEADPFMAALAQAMMVPVADEGTSSAVVPIVVRGPAEKLAELQHLDLASSLDAEAQRVREELLGSIATGLDLPKEIITGVADLNHWTAWQVDDNTFRHHVEPHVIMVCDSLTGAFLRPYLEEMDCDPAWVQRLVFWYDPTELVTHPDQTKDALELHDRLCLSDKALRQIAGFDEEDGPTKAETQIRLIEKMRNWPPNLVMAFLHAWDPTLIAPAMKGPPAIPGIGPTGVSAPPEGEGEAPAAELPPGEASGGKTPTPPAAEVGEPTPPPTRPMPAPPVAHAAPGLAQMDMGALAHMLAAELRKGSGNGFHSVDGELPADGPQRRSAGLASRRAARKLVQIDQDLRARLHVAANAAMMRQLERAGERMRKTVARDERLRRRIAHTPTWLVTATLGPDVVSAAGLDPNELLSSKGDWGKFKGQFMDWTAQAQQAALQTAIQLGELDAESEAVRAAEGAMAAGLDTAWSTLSEQMGHLAHSLLYEPGIDPLAEVNPDTVVPTGMIRIALGLAGGAEEVAKDPGGIRDVSLGVPVGQIGTGATIGDLLTQAGGELDTYEWVHGAAINPFEPHEELDGTQFASFEAEPLANAGDWPANQFYFPGDHQGCSCDFMPIILAPSEAQGEAEPAQAGE
jgi:hypothetical protein